MQRCRARSVLGALSVAKRTARLSLLRHTTTIVTSVFVAAFAVLVFWRVLSGPKKKRLPPAPVVQAAPEPIPLEPPVPLLRVENSGLPCDIDEVLAKKCRRCHTLPPRHSAPLQLMRWEDAHADRHGSPVYQLLGRAVTTGYMPFAIMANPPIERLTDPEKKTLLDWVAAGAPRGGCGEDAGIVDAGSEAGADAATDAGKSRKPRRSAN